EEEVFSIEDLVHKWRIDQVQKAGGKFDRERLDWFNGVWIRRLSVRELIERLEPAVPIEWNRETLKNAVPLIRERMRRLTEAREQLEFLFTDDIPVGAADLVPKGRDPGETARILGRCAFDLRLVTPFDSAGIESSLRLAADEGKWSIRDMTIVL